jgi:hypothetical protein
LITSWVSLSSASSTSKTLLMDARVLFSTVYERLRSIWIISKKCSTRRNRACKSRILVGGGIHKGGWLVKA